MGGRVVSLLQVKVVKHVCHKIVLELHVFVKVGITRLEIPSGEVANKASILEYIRSFFVRVEHQKKTVNHHSDYEVEQHTAQNEVECQIKVVFELGVAQ